jgi:hypothetical protein
MWLRKIKLTCENSVIWIGNKERDLGREADLDVRDVEVHGVGNGIRGIPKLKLQRNPPKREK